VGGHQLGDMPMDGKEEIVQVFRGNSGFRDLENTFIDFLFRPVIEEPIGRAEIVMTSLRKTGIRGGLGSGRGFFGGVTFPAGFFFAFGPGFIRFPHLLATAIRAPQ